MKTIKCVSLMLIAFVSIMGCSENYGKLKIQSESESKVTQRELIDNWSDYDIWLIDRRAQLAVIIFDPKNDIRKILVGSDWRKVKDQEMWQEIVKTNTTSDGDFKLPGAGPGGTSRVQEIWGPDNQLYGFIIYQGYSVRLGNAKLVEKNTIRLSLAPPTPRTGH